MAAWFDPFYNLLTQAENTSIPSDDDDVPTAQEQLKTEICQIVAMYATKYDEEFVVSTPIYTTTTHIATHTFVMIWMGRILVLGASAKVC